MASTKNRVWLLLAPTRELAEQSGRVVKALADFLPGVTTQVVVGGHKITEKLKLGSRVISGTPGRVLQMLKDPALAGIWKTVEQVVLDEADELLMNDQGFKEQINDICRHIQQKQKIQKILVSATLPEAVLELTETLMNDPIRILMTSLH